MRTIVFLDIDGVLNSTQWAGRRPARGLVPPSTADEAFAGEWIDPAAVSRLREIVDRTNASIVLMSSWRNRMDVMEFRRLLSLHGWGAAPVIGATPTIRGASRGDEVNAWLQDVGGPVHHICIDDDSDFLPHQTLIQTNPDVGITDDDVTRCVKALADASR